MTRHKFIAGTPLADRAEAKAAAAMCEVDFKEVA